MTRAFLRTFPGLVASVLGIWAAGALPPQATLIVLGALYLAMKLAFRIDQRQWDAQVAAVYAARDAHLANPTAQTLRAWHDEVVALEAMHRERK